MNTESALPYDRLYIQFIKLFNEERDYYQCHDVMEELWLEEGRKPLLQGLLQVAVGLHHFQNGNRPGAIKLLTAALQKLDAYPDIILGIDLQQLRNDSEETLDKLCNCDASLPPFQDLTIRIVDKELGALIECCELPSLHE
ncbi:MULTISPECIES: DUF309 domain-containing protein [Paenibacillus]|uniref:DUF309 domain-containing protein n=1 Tax=Paenibacillus alvei TaxID=44250 RepID=A0ABT4E2R5_PAEAL|nr:MULTISPECIES: DUF309 domain-containing protein [Paenibacillus]EPY13756.1 hypothetical protein PAAL66ix_05754 [Paenibacillus alvei A6-6i-x]MCY9528013.1 DUF309 domain-containing protein [Paenibacillus alvei]SDF52701.1 hypothetical protein SAMN04488689_105262 [Paenibacillus sp. cl6col]